MREILRCENVRCINSLLKSRGENAFAELALLYQANHYKIIAPLGGSVVGQQGGSIDGIPLRDTIPAVLIYRIEPRFVANYFAFLNNLSRISLTNHLKLFLTEKRSSHARITQIYSPLLEMYRTAFGPNDKTYTSQLSAFVAP